MHRRRVSVGVLVVFLAAGIVGAQMRDGDTGDCDVCERGICRGATFTVRLSCGRTRHTCCPRCGIRFEKAHPGAARSAWVKDFSTGREIAAEQAVYVEGSDFSHCNPPRVARDRDGACFAMCYDRCAPSLVAFADRRAAEGFTAQHGGTLRSFAVLLQE